MTRPVDRDPSATAPRSPAARTGPPDGGRQEDLVDCQQTDITAAVGPPKTAAEIVAPQETPTVAAVAMFES
ncbi:hypothetical protein GCM10011574_65670 [Microbispora bryophytorum]|uniref:Uncharacterized protein n=1 Tax=Microbispora bryophytorum TaxID=1460882 RepID=A0A8H9LH58_9ACTN|nr:hypothetical protein GCM10011574_65670 [Microbispora bryophytorum]